MQDLFSFIFHVQNRLSNKVMEPMSTAATVLFQSGHHRRSAQGSSPSLEIFLNATTHTQGLSFQDGLPFIFSHRER
jgi:hypothetical protein